MVKVGAHLIRFCGQAFHFASRPISIDLAGHDVSMAMAVQSSPDRICAGGVQERMYQAHLNFFWAPSYYVGNLSYQVAKSHAS